MQRWLLVLAAGVFGVVAIYLAIQELTDTPTTTTTEEPLVEGGGARSVGVSMRDIAFMPENVSIRAGQTVEWRNDDQTEHTVTYQAGPGNEFDSGEIAPGETYERMFAERGVIRYICTIHSDQMRARITILGD